MRPILTSLSQQAQSLPKICKMKNLLIILLMVAMSSPLFAQLYVVDNADVHFYSYARLENIEAHNKEAKAVINTEDHSFSFRIPIKSFVFAQELMQEHFNENYMESDTYPNGSFKGTIDGEYDLLSDGEYDVDAVGQLDIHGVVQERRIPSVITVTDGVPEINAKFMVKLVDHKIKIPKVVFYNIAEEIEVTVRFALQAYEKE